MTQPNSIREWQDREEQAERREQALARQTRRQQYELFDELMEDSDPCPNCGEIGFEAVYGISEDLSVGYSCEEQGCTACLADLVGRAK